MGGAGGINAAPTDGAIGDSAVGGTMRSTLAGSLLAIAGGTIRLAAAGGAACVIGAGVDIDVNGASGGGGYMAHFF
jgi:hypothetical protein